MKWFSTFLCAPLCFILLFIPLSVRAKPLLADLSQYHINIDSNFTGANLLLFGSRNDPGDIIVVVRGPEKTFTVRKKERVAGIWINNDRERFEHVPSYYAIASSRPIASITHADLFMPLHIGLNAILEKPAQNTTSFGQALIRQTQENHLYSSEPMQVSFMGESLFKLVLPFPDNIPRGEYSADVYLFHDGELEGMQSIPLYVEKTGFDALIYDFSRSHSVLYGMGAVLLALGMGWSASTVMQRLS